MRNPMLPLCVAGSSADRDAQRAAPAPVSQLPPRTTCVAPDEAPDGSSTSSAGYAPYKSPVHSETLPCMSTSPQALGGNPPPRVVCSRNIPEPVPAFGSLPLKLAWTVVMVSPVENAVAVPARQAYSHSASVGSR